ncbi:MAG: hypothetical protein CMM02_05425 [Rhodopirellula sp.]|nr:hypothetical protein [Rhodopirellula sp.]|tara:strand:- start:5813 stop:7030 length:1218 start_codon:yes stop_codon:yes gene_type:complete
MESITYILILFLVVFSFILRTIESSLFSIKSWRNRQIAKKIQNKYFSLINDTQELMTTLTLATAISNACIVALLVLNFEELQILHFMLLFCILLIIIALLCDIIPKTLTLKAPHHWVLFPAKPIYLFHLIMRPLGLLAEKISNKSSNLLIPKGIKSNLITTEEEFAELIDWAYQQGVLERSEREMMIEIIKLDQKTAEEVMKPRSEMICIEDDALIDDMISAAKKYKYTRLPIFNDKPDNIVGILNTRKLLLQPKEDLSESIEFPSFVPASMNLMDLLKSLQTQRRGLAIVLDEFGGTAGLITIEDVLEELVGEMREEGEKAEFTIEKLNRNRWRVNGNLPIDDFKKIAPDFFSLKDVDTMGGLITALKEVVPKNGQSARMNDFELTVVASDERRVKELIVKKIR